MKKIPQYFFGTVSSAVKYWPEMHYLMMHTATSPTRQMHVQPVIDHPHVVPCS